MKIFRFILTILFITIIATYQYVFGNYRVYYISEYKLFYMSILGDPHTIKFGKSLLSLNNDILIHKRLSELPLFKIIPYKDTLCIYSYYGCDECTDYYSYKDDSMVFQNMFSMSSDTFNIEETILRKDSIVNLNNKFYIEIEWNLEPVVISIQKNKRGYYDKGHVYRIL